MITIRTYVVDLQGAGGGMVEIFDHTGTVVGKAALGPSECADGEREVQITEIPLQNVHLWNGTKDPYLYKVRARLLAKDGEILDEVTTSMGVRDFFLDPQKGFFLNGVSYPLHGVSRHQDRKGIGNALLPCHHLEDMEMICEMGANTIRLAHYQQDQYFLDLCDQKGMIVWAEIPFISEFLEEGVQNTMDQMRELVTQNYNHPSIVVWGISNEITMMSHQKENITQNHVKLKQLIRELDPQRPVSVAVIASCDPDHPYLKVPDILSFNLYLGWYSGNVEDSGPWLDAVHRKFPEIPIGLSEYGCEAAGWHSSTPEAGDYSEEYQAFYHEKMIEQLWNRPYLWATHVWNMFDFGSDAKDEGGEAGQNHKGLVTFDRLYKKDAFYAYKAWLSDEPFVHICGKNYVDHTEDVVVVRVYSNQPEVELYVNGSSVGTQYAENHFFSFEVSNIGCSELTAKAGKCVDTRILRKVNTPNEKYVLNDEGMVLNWYEITDIPGYYSIKDTIGNIYENLITKRDLIELNSKLNKIKKQI